jgi:hypothetical protein
MSLMSSRESWRAIRTIRAEPQGAARGILSSDETRRREFHVALEQAQQQFAAAERIGYESRALNLFYGLSQAGRAIAAAAPMLGGHTDEQWQGTGHGIAFSTGIPTGVMETPIRLKSTDRDLFSRVSIAVKSPLDFGSIAFGALVNQLLDYTIIFREPEGYPRPILDVRVHDPASKTFPVRVEVPVPKTSGQQQLVTPDEIRERLAPYPALSGLDVAVTDEGAVQWSWNAGRCFVVVPNREQIETAESVHNTGYLVGTTAYRRTRVILPKAGSSDSPLRPLMSWWATLFALSMLARYAPGAWAATLSIPSSPIASRIEFLLDTALDAVPEIIFEELSRL